MTELSPHIPDLDLITYYSEKGGTVFSRISPWTKAFMLLLIIFFVTVSRSLILIAIVYALTLAAYWMARRPGNKLFRGYLLPMAFVLSLVLILMWNEPGTPLLRVPGLGLTLTSSGLILVLMLTLKALTSITYSLFFLMTTRYNHFSAMIYRIFPSPVDQIFLMSYRFIFLTLRMIDSMVKAMRSRGGGLIKSIRRQGSLFAEIFALTLIRSYDRADRVYKAMESRGFSGKYFAATEVPGIRLPEYALMAAAVALTAYSLLFVKLPL